MFFFTGQWRLPAAAVVIMLFACCDPGRAEDAPAWPEEPGSDQMLAPVVDEPLGPGCGLCFRERPRPNCCWSVVFESAVRIRATDVNVRERKSENMFTLDAGLMRNLNDCSAMGGSFYLSGDEDGARFGLRYRYRYWLSRYTCIDLSPGILFAGTDDFQKPKMPGLVASASLAVVGLVSFDAHFEMYRYKERTYDWSSEQLVNREGTIRAFYVGLTGRSWLVVFAPAIAIVAAALDPPEVAF